MADVWVYAASRDGADELVAALAELGHSAHYAGTGEPVVPPAPGRPALAVVVWDAGGLVDGELVARLGAASELDGVAVLLAVPPEGLAACPGLTEADELLVGPFTHAELDARVTRATRGAVSAESALVVRAGLLELNPATYGVAIAGEPVGFTYMEYELLKFLMTHPNRVFSREALLKRVWGYDYYGGARTVDVHIRRVRAKLGQEHAHRVKTVRSVGYLFELPSARAANGRAYDINSKHARHEVETPA
jgi:DNA-binding response OmpR family regulator